MDASYDEDLSQNPFFAEFRSEHPELLEQCILNEWLICVPRVGTVLSHIFTLQDFLGHILIANDDLPETHFTTLTEKSARVISKVISIDQNNSGLPLEIHILFEETFYTVDHMKYKVWCIEYPLESEFQLKASNVSRCSALQTLRDCIDFLWTESSGKDVLESIDSNIADFKTKFIKLQNVSLNRLKDMVGALYTSCLQKAFANRRLKERCRGCKNIMDNVKLAVETYMLHGIYKEIFGALSTCSAFEDSCLNKTIRNISDLQLRDLEIKQDFYETIPMAKRNLSLIQSFSTILGKVGCIGKTISAINKSSSNLQKNNYYVTTDELLPIFIFLVIKCGLPNWYAHLNFIKHFRFSVHSHLQSDEVSFCISTLEAVVEHIKSGIFTACPCPESQCQLNHQCGFEYKITFDENHASQNKSQFDDSLSDNFEMVGYCNKIHGPGKSDVDTDSLAYLFEQVRLSNIDKVKQILQKNKLKTVPLTSSIEDSTDGIDFQIRKTLSLDEVLNDDLEKSPTLCHPLCACFKCSRIVTNNLLRTSPTVFSCDEHGFTLLHMASIYGQPLIADLALEMGAKVNSTDYNGSTPLHYAASRGHQNVIFLLLQAEADVNRQNMDKNTALHLASNNGHECCVKAIIFFKEFCLSNLKIDVQNDNGDYPIHLASKWGYEGIVALLLEHGADPWLPNKKGKTSIDFAHSSRTTKLLLSTPPNMSEYVKVDRENSKQDSSFSDSSKVDINLLDLSDNMEMFYSTSPVKQTESKLVTSAKKSMKPLSTNDIRHIERLFRSIAYGDTKLACFYMNLDNKENSEISYNGVNNKEVCHPLCSCKKCLNLKQTTINDDGEFDINTCDSQGNTALHIAVENGRIEICDVLLNNGAIPNIQNKSGMTPFHIAAKENKLNAAQLLITFDTNISVKDSIGNTPLHLACIAGNVEIVKIILDKEPCANVMNFSGKTPLDEAKDKMHLTIIALLEESLCIFSTKTA